MTTVTVDRSWRSYVERIGSPTAGSQRVVLPVLLVLSFGSIPRWADAASQALNIVIAGVGLAGFASWIFFSVGALVIRLVAPRPGCARGNLFLFLYGAVEVVRAVILALYLYSMGVMASIDWGFEVVAGFTTGLALYATMALFIGDAEQYRNDMRMLLDVRERLQTALGNLEKDIRQRREELLSSVRAVVSGAVQSVMAQRESGSPADTRLVAQLNRISSDVVRPLSHSMYGLQALDGTLGIDVKPPKIRFNRVATIATTVSAFRPTATTALILLLLMPAIFFRTELLNGILTLLGTIIWSFGLMWLVKRLVLPRIQKLAFIWRSLIIIFIYALFSVGLMLVVVDSARLEIPVSLAAQALYGMVLGIPLLSIIAITPATRQARAEALAETARANEELSWMTARLGAELWADRRAIAKTLHQDVQGVLVAAAFRLQRAIDLGQDIDVAAEEVYDIVSLAANFAVAPAAAPTMDYSLELLRDRWSGILTIRFDSDENSTRLLSLDSVARQLMQETISEFATNSVKHGLSSEAVVTVRSFDPKLLTISLTNDGGPISDDARFEGLGSRMMLTMGINGTYENLATGGVALRAQIPVDGLPHTNQV